MTKFVCSICGKEYDDLPAYMACVSKCGEEVLLREREEKQKKYLEEVNAGLNRIKEAEKYLKDVEEEFKKKFPKEYELNFGKNECSCDENTCKCKNNEDLNNKQPKEQREYLEFTYKDNGKDKPKFSAKVNGEEIDYASLSKLLENYEVPYFSELLRMI